MNCPKCGKWLFPQSVAKGNDLPPENDDYEIVDNKDFDNGQANTPTE